MVAPSDIEYKKTKLIKQGKKRIAEKFENLAKWISDKYEVNVLDIQEEFMKHNGKVEIAVHLETHQEVMEFKNGNDRWSDFDITKQNEIAEKYIQNGKLLKIPASGIWGKLVKRNPEVNEIFVSYSAFEPIARDEVNELIPDSKIEKLYKDLKLPEIWTISRSQGSATLFVFKDEQKDKIKNSTEFKLIEEKYFDLLKEYDEFNYWKRKNFGIEIDSKQNFDDNYKSNWYYYYK
ncbi:hypothetical protein [Zunongwangia atlantica]|uniref:Uncharacterized protein n=1 Tax=Zunongwangia atlantica 22II14-10F7 TaxID=1185767 RepID=A0A1Y1T2N9_9FLAO|nr:hypothetical protein [Zunongwangia atlantica]ORL45052.1 hypothetical protein IIF7_13095 [Zunongwangia atlantica 22II14-10F7]